MILDAFHKKIILIQLRKKYWDPLSEKEKTDFLSLIDKEDFKGALHFEDGDNPYVQVWTWNRYSKDAVSAGVFYKHKKEFEDMFEELLENLERAQRKGREEHDFWNPPGKP